MSETKHHTLTPDEVESLREYVRDLAMAVMDEMKQRMMSDMDGHVDPTIGAHAAGLAAMLCLYMATDSDEDRESFIADMAETLSLITETDPCTKSDEGESLDTLKFPFSVPSRTVH